MVLVNVHFLLVFVLFHRKLIATLNANDFHTTPFLRNPASLPHRVASGQSCPGSSHTLPITVPSGMNSCNKLPHFILQYISFMVTITLLLNSISPFSFRKLSNCTLDGLDSQNGYRTLIVSGGKMCYTWVSKLTGKSESEGLNDMNLSLIDEYVYLVLLDNGWTEKRDFLLADRWIEKIEQESNFYF